jgi:hypothetical protein
VTIELQPGDRGQPPVGRHLATCFPQDGVSLHSRTGFDDLMLAVPDNAGVWPASERTALRARSDPYSWTNPPTALSTVMAAIATRSSVPPSA